ncbi:hypothetical protein EII17_13960 [Clostridiales bacterium COT073_COT-073]|nr:hypothetical protein EII17_13960 [Clostridiales bacterium COT073_COT-073]
MNTKEMIKLLIDVEVDTEDLRLLKEHPKEHVATKREAWKLEQLFLLLENAKEGGCRNENTVQTFIMADCSCTALHCGVRTFPVYVLLYSAFRFVGAILFLCSR